MSDYKQQRDKITLESYELYVKNIIVKSLVKKDSYSWNSRLLRM